MICVSLPVHTQSAAIAGRLANIGWTRRHLPQCTRTCLHSSNGMLARPGLARRPDHPLRSHIDGLGARLSSSASTGPALCARLP